ncbi:MAG: WYL domain-containing protein [Clostridia bacterium]|nr:WYL domain-containing protein [Clostridia bacterium]
MIFSELYSAYYNAVAHILSSLAQGKTDRRELEAIVSRYAFGESGLHIVPSLLNGDWQLTRRDLSTPIRHTPTMPLTELERRFLKSVSLDRRVRLFDFDFSWLDDTQPLFTEADYCVYDRYNDGDPFEDEGYIRRFRLILRAIREKRQIKFEMISRKGRTVFVRCHPARLEYSEKDDKFRLLTGNGGFVSTVNLSRMISCTLYQGDKTLPMREKEPLYETLVLRVANQRNAPERVLLHFAHFEKRVEKLPTGAYQVTLRYEREDEPEMVIRILSFGPLVEVIAPDDFRELIIDKLKKQLHLGLK